MHHFLIILTTATALLPAQLSAENQRGIKVAAVTNDRPQLVIPQGHSFDVKGMDWSPDGRYLVTCSRDQTAKLWDTEAGLELHTFAGHEGAVTDVCFNGDGSLIASGSTDKTIRLWDTRSGREVKKYMQKSGVYSVSFGPDNKVLVWGGGDGKIRLINSATGEFLRYFQMCHKGVANVSIADKRRRVIGDDGYDIRAWELATGERIQHLKTKGWRSSSAFDSSGNRLAVGKDKGGVEVLDTVSGKQICEFGSHTSAVISVAFSSDGKRMISGGREGEVFAWDARNGDQIVKLAKHQYLNVVAMSPDGRRAATVSSSSVRIHDVATGKILRTISGTGLVVASAAFSPDWRIIACNGSENRVKVLDTKTAKEIHGLTNGKWGCSQVDISPDGRLLAAGGLDRAVGVWNTETWKKIRTLDDPGVFIHPLRFSPNSHQLVSGRLGRRLRLFDLDTGVVLRTMEHDLFTESVNWDRAGTLIVRAGGREGMRNLLVPPASELVLWDPRTGNRIRTLNGHTDTVFSAAFSPDDARLVSGSADKTLKVWDVNTGRIIHSRDNHHAAVRSVCWSNDGKLFASGGDDLTIRIWKADAATELMKLSGHRWEIHSLTFDRNGNRLASASKDGTIRLWDLEKGKELVSLIPLAKDGWVAVTPDGRFDGSEQAVKQLYYVQNVKNVIPLESFYEKYYTPNLLARIISGDKSISSPLKTGAIDDLRLPPAVRIESPDDGTITKRSTAKIKIRVTDQGGGVDELRLYQNGKLVAGEQRGVRVQPGKLSSRTESLEVTLLPGINEFRATAFSPSRLESISHTIQVERKGGVPTAELFVLVIGINDYDNPRYRLNYGRPDAEAFASNVQKYAANIFEAVAVKALYDGNATRQSLVESLKDIGSRAGPEDAFVFYFAGHGVMSEGDDNNPSDFYLVPKDVTRLYGNDDLLRKNALSSQELKDWCLQIKAQKQLVLLDACQSGGAIETFAVRGAAEEKAIHQLARSAGVYVIASAGSEQMATEFKELGHGVFTYALLQGLKGAADGGTKDGKITVGELRTYIEDAVPELSRKYRGTVQYPNVFSRGQDFPLGIVD